MERRYIEAKRHVYHRLLIFAVRMGNKRLIQKFAAEILSTLKLEADHG